MVQTEDTYGLPIPPDSPLRSVSRPHASAPSTLFGLLSDANAASSLETTNTASSLETTNTQRQEAASGGEGGRLFSAKSKGSSAASETSDMSLSKFGYQPVMAEEPFVFPLAHPKGSREEYPKPWHVTQSQAGHYVKPLVPKREGLTIQQKAKLDRQHQTITHGDLSF